jgi:hypothetical protein
MKKYFTVLQAWQNYHKTTDKFWHLEETGGEKLRIPTYSECGVPLNFDYSIKLTPEFIKRDLDFKTLCPKCFDFSRLIELAAVKQNR